MSYIEHLICTRHFVRAGDTKIKPTAKIYVQVVITTGIEQKRQLTRLGNSRNIKALEGFNMKGRYLTHTIFSWAIHNLTSHCF